MFLLGLSEQLQESSKIWFIALAALVIFAWPVKYALQQSLAGYFIRSYQPPAVTSNPYTPEALVAVKKDFVSVSAGTYSAYAQVRNPNAELSAKKFEFRFLFRDKDGASVGSFSGESHVLAGESRFVLLPTASLPETPASVDLVFDEVNWVRRVPAFDVKFEVLQKSTGRTSEGGFFVEFLVKNPQGYRLKKVDIQAIIFDSSSRDILAVNMSQFTDLKPFESRYVRLVWPRTFLDVGEVQVSPQVNQLEPGAVLDQDNKVPVR